MKILLVSKMIPRPYRVETLYFSYYIYSQLLAKLYSTHFFKLYFFINSLMDWNDTELENSQKAKKESVINSHHQKP